MPHMQLGWTCRECGFWNVDTAEKCQDCRRINYHEPWRPFAPSVNAEDRQEVYKAAFVRVQHAAQEMIRNWRPSLHSGDWQYENFVHPHDWEDGHTVGD